MDLNHEQIRDLAREVVKEDGLRPTWLYRALPVAVAVIALGTGSLGTYSVKAIFALNQTVAIVGDLQQRVSEIERKGSPSLESYMREDTSRETMQTERISKLEQAIVGNTADHARIMSDLASIQVDLRWLKEYLTKVRP